jgi:hypothetical protein
VKRLTVRRTDDLEAELREVFAGVGRWHARRGVRITLERPWVQVRTLTELPSVSRRRLVEMIRLQSRRFFRANGGPLVVDAIWLPAPRGQPRAALAAAAEAAVLDRLTEMAGEAGVRVRGIQPGHRSALGLNLLPAGQRRARGQAAWRRAACAVSAAATAWLGVLGLAWVAQVQALLRVERELARQAPAVAAVERVRREFRTAMALVSTSDSLAQERGRMLSLLGDLTEALPATAYVTQVALHADGKGRATLVGHRALGVLAALARSGRLVHPRLDGPVNRVTAQGGDPEAFTVVFGGDSLP